MLEAADLHCERGGRTIFKKLSFSLLPRNVLLVTGANGSGKTSLLRILCGLLSPSAGEVRWNGTAIRSLKEEYARQLVYLGHAPGVKDELSPAENLEIACDLAGLQVSNGEVRGALARFGLAEEQAVKQLSQGQRRRAALARLALSAQVPLWLLDEPFAALDAAATALVEELIQGHVARGGAVVYSAHQPSNIDSRALMLAL
jgi:heme exporter protein A